MTGLSFTGGCELSPGFSSSTNAYTCTVPSSTSSVFGRSVVEEGYGYGFLRYELGENFYTSSTQSIPIAYGVNTIIVVVEGTDDTLFTTTVTITRTDGLIPLIPHRLIPQKGDKADKEDKEDKEDMGNLDSHVQGL
mgnify:CR=1 FL=1